MSKLFALLVVIFSLTVAESALAGDWRGNGGGYGSHGWSHPHSVYGGGRGSHNGGYYGGDRHHGGKNDFLYGVLAGTIAGVIIAQPPPAYYSSPQPMYPAPPQRCWTEWRPAYGLYDRYGNQLGQTVTACQ